jgi:cytochrome c553/mono/diheme cytochrome c family protein
MRLRSRGAVFAASFAALVWAHVWSLSAQTPAQPSAVAVEFFESNVRPVLAESCFRCHTATETAGLRVDSREALLKGGDSGPAIVPGDPDASLLIKAIRHAGDAPKMPMSGSKLSDAKIAAFAQWVRDGAVFPASSTTAAAPAAAEKSITPEQRAFWAFQPIRRVAPPTPSDQTWAKTDIDRFILARLEQEGLKPVRSADRRTLLRRATLDLTGLPATPEDIEAFEKDESPDAFAKVVDRLLASPRYGEAWARMWLDVARYGEDDPRSLDPEGRGYAPYPNAYLYRDWVVKAFNDDLPYDQFVKAQIAGDLLDENMRARTLPALGFLGLGPWYYDNGAVEITRADERHDRIDVVTRGFLGVTVACARCHDHKYDPIPTKDYYALAGVFMNTEYHEYPLAPKAVVEEYKAKEKKVEQKQKLLSEFLDTESKQLAETLAFQTSKYLQAAWRVTGEPKEPVGKVVDQEKLDYELFEKWIAFLKKPPRFYPYLKPWQEMIKSGGTAAEAKKLADEFQTLLLDVMFAKKDVDEENEIIRAKALPGTKKKKPSNLPNEFVTNDDFCPGCGLELKSIETDKMQLWTDVFRRDLDEGFDPVVMMTSYIKPGVLMFRGWGLERQLSGDRRTHIDVLRNDIKAAKAALGPRFTYVHGVRDLEKPQNAKVNLRGNPHRLGDEVPRRFLSVLSEGEPAAFQKGSGRLELADRIAKEPIAARVIVNRVWKQHFGTGIVNSPSNFGINGERPVHPELLEHLASFFVENGMSIKKLHREIMLSAVYQLSSDHAQMSADKDSGNRLYWRANRQRLTAEQLRDSVLFVSGALDLKMGGPPAPLTPSYARRTIYGGVSRYRMDQFLQLFDFPAPTITAEQRYATNVPLQRLFLMNSDFMQQQAELLARRAANEADTTAQIQKVYRILFGRAASAEEVAAGQKYLADEPLRAYEERKAEAAKNAADTKKPDAPMAPAMSDDETRDKDMGNGMMAGVTPGAGKEEEKKKLLPVTALGRYIKVLLSSNEFLFSN